MSAARLCRSPRLVILHAHFAHSPSFDPSGDFNEWVGYEYAKVHRLYDQLGIGDRTEIEYFDGPHTINGKGTFKFLHKWLQWPSNK